MLGAQKATLTVGHVKNPGLQCGGRPILSLALHCRHRARGTSPVVVSIACALVASRQCLSGFDV